MNSASEGLGVAGPSGSRRNPERAVSLPTGRLATRSHRPSLIEEGLQIECATEKLKSKLEQLKGKLSELKDDFHQNDLTSISDERIRSILSTVILHAPCSVSCARCPQFRPDYPIRFERKETAQRLFAMCILVDDPFLICQLLTKGLDDAKFGACKSEEDLVRDTSIPPGTAKELFKLKDSFFRVSIVKYIRSKRADNDLPEDAERHFVMDELLIMMEQLEARAKAGRRYSISIGELTIKKSSQMVYERPIGRCPPFWDGEVSIQTLGSLVLDVIWFLIGGSQNVLRLDGHRFRDTWTAAWVRLIPPEEIKRLRSEPKLEKAFELAWIMIQPRGPFGLSGIDVDDYHWAVVHFHQIWPQIEEDNIEDPGPSRSRSPDAMSVSTRNPGIDRFSASESYEEINAPDLRWLFLRCQKEKREETPCRLRIYKAKSGLRIRFNIYIIKKRPVEHKEYYVRLDGLKFVPLYVYTATPGDFSAKLLPNTGSARDIELKHSFRFHSRADVRIFQEALTGRKIEADVKLDKMTLDVRREHEIRVGKMKVGSKWGSVEEIPRDSGTIQLWRVLEQDDLDYVHKRGQHLPHGTKENPLRLELAIFSEDTFIIIGVTSLLKVREWGRASYGLTITSKDTTSSSMLVGREYIAELQDDEKIYPGLRLFQKAPFELPTDGKKVRCQCLTLRFASAADRAEIRDILTGTYNASVVEG